MPILHYSISGNAGTAGVTITVTGAGTGSTISAADGTYTIGGLIAGVYIVTPTLTSASFTPTSSSQTIIVANLTNVSFVAYYSQPDCRNFGQFPNIAVNVNGTLTYTTSTSPSVTPPVDSRVSQPVTSSTYSQNSRTPGTYGPGE